MLLLWQWGETGFPRRAACARDPVQEVRVVEGRPLANIANSLWEATLAKSMGLVGLAPPHPEPSPTILPAHFTSLDRGPRSRKRGRISHNIATPSYPPLQCVNLLRLPHRFPDSCSGRQLASGLRKEREGGQGGRLKPSAACRFADLQEFAARSVMWGYVRAGPGLDATRPSFCFRVFLREDERAGQVVVETGVWNECVEDGGRDSLTADAWALGHALLPLDTQAQNHRGLKRT